MKIEHAVTEGLSSDRGTENKFMSIVLLPKNI